jgi:hypothetical protein
LTRTNVGANPVWLTFTPLQGVSTVVKRFLHEKSPDRHKVVMTIDDVDHYSDFENLDQSKNPKSPAATRAIDGTF